ncbi:hypothetical protein DF122_14265 [Burkholderia pseudomallei]|nr:hypothetical protein DF127_16350 [Burkholderia pseudomallei]RQS92521.1 hypothetical protein DF125_15150 [Burkholderia pseudomallei]RSK64955.1 hypothetical protein DF122_14265 [Burkholderia pseudomallei]
MRAGLLEDSRGIGTRVSVLVGRGARFAVHGSRFTVHGSRFTVHGSRFTVHGSRFDDCWLRVAVRVSCLVSRVLCFVLSPGVHRWVTCDARS